MPNIRILNCGDHLEAEVGSEVLEFQTFAECAEHFGIDGEQLADQMNDAENGEVEIKVN
jgi:hypothetical protein